MELRRSVRIQNQLSNGREKPNYRKHIRQYSKKCDDSYFMCRKCYHHGHCRKKCIYNTYPPFFEQYFFHSYYHCHYNHKQLFIKKEINDIIVKYNRIEERFDYLQLHDLTTIGEEALVTEHLQSLERRITRTTIYWQETCLLVKHHLCRLRAHKHEINLNYFIISKLLPFPDELVTTIMDYIPLYEFSF